MQKGYGCVERLILARSNAGLGRREGRKEKKFDIAKKKGGTLAFIQRGTEKKEKRAPQDNRKQKSRYSLAQGGGTPSVPKGVGF